MFQMISDNLPIVKDLPSPEGKWELVEVIGEGNYGEVFKARNMCTGEMAAAKVMEAVIDKEEDIKAELNVFQNHSHHPNIVNFHGAFVKKDPISDDQLWIVMEYCTGGSVTDLVKHMKEKGESLAEDVISYILREVLMGMSYLHESCVLHRDIKGQNVLFTSDAKVKLIDFGISAMVDRSTGKRRTAIGTPYWMAPEVIACEQQLEYEYDARADVWSLGITAIEIADSTPPLFGENPMRALFKIPKHKSPTVQNPLKWSKHFNDFIARCLIKDFEKRPHSRELLLHRFVRFVPKDPKVLRRKLMQLIDMYQHGEPPDVFSDSSTSTSGVDTIKRNLKAVRTSEMVDDLAMLEFIDESVILSQLKKRYRKRLIYTYVGNILISINPFQKLDIYNEKFSKKYCSVARGSVPPHIFAVAGSAYQAMLREGKNQCCVVSGESGAGKTEASNILVQQFMKLGKAETQTLEEKILKVNPLMESFGNARTVINNNSSRFGKYLELHFTTDGHIVGARLSEYLLEKSRVVLQARRERNFHIFYYLLAGLSTRHQLAEYKLQGVHHHKYLEQRGTGKGSSKRNAIFSERFDLIEDAFKLFGFSAKDFQSVCSILAAILNIGDIRLETDFHSHLGEVSAISNRDTLHNVSELLQIKVEHFEKAVTTTRVITHGETIVRPNTMEQALDVRDAVAKALYGRLFSWIVNRVNPTLNPPVDRSTKLRNIGILDIFGFENFRTNSFEQLCINVANEQLQFYFNQHIFAWEQEEYEREGVDAVHVQYTDNRPLLDLLLSRPMGLMALLDEESKFPQATDLSLAAKFHNNFKTSLFYKKPKDRGPTFTVHHYAGPVTYETTGFLEKNRDTLRSDVSILLKKSTNSIVRALFFTPLSRTGSLSAQPSSLTDKLPSATPLFSRRAPNFGKRGRLQPGQYSSGHASLSSSGHTPLSSSGTLTASRSQTVSTHFINSLRELVSKMLTGTPHFVRCIRPNDLKSPDQFNPEKVVLQLRYTGVLETTRIRKEGYSHRILFEDFIQRYKVISYPLSRPVDPTPTNCVQILMQAGLEKWALGHSKVFLKYYHVDRLFQIFSNYDRSATKVQNVIRGWLARKKAAKLRAVNRENAAVKIQAVVRGYQVRCWYQRTLLLREQAAVILQSAVRMRLARRRYLQLLQQREIAAVRIQSALRGFLARNKLKKDRQKRESKRREQDHPVSLRWRLQHQLLVSAKDLEEKQQRHKEKEEGERQREPRERRAAKLMQRERELQEKSAVVIQRAYRTMHRQSRKLRQERPPPISHKVPYHRRQRVTGPLMEYQLPRVQSKPSPRHVVRYGERASLRPSVMNYYEDLQRETVEQMTEETSFPVRQGTPALSHYVSGVSVPRQATSHARSVFEELIEKHSLAAQQDHPQSSSQWRARRGPFSRVKGKHQTKPDNVIQKLLDHFQLVANKT